MRRVLLASVGLVVSIGTAQAACIPTPSCSTLGYESSTACEGGLKCPFGEYWNCTLVNKITEVETKVTEIIENGGASGGGDTSNCVVGSIFYSDKTCSYGSVIATKAPIGVVTYVDGEGHGIVVALQTAGSHAWGPIDNDIPELENGTAGSSCENTAIITAAGDENTYPAAWAAKKYSTVGTSAGDWCLPTVGAIGNSTAVDKTLELLGGTAITEGSGVDYSLWSSNEKDGTYAYFEGGGYGYNNSFTKEDFYRVRPVLEF